MNLHMTSNAADIVRQLDGVADSLDFDHSVGNMSLGKRMAEATADAIEVRSVVYQKGATAQWEPNKSPYREWKEEKYNVYALAGVRTGQMLSLESLRGETTVTAREVEMVYGTDTAPTHSASSSYFSDADGKVTDRQKAGWFTEGGRYQAARPFYELDEDIAAAVFGIVSEAVDRILKG